MEDSVLNWLSFALTYCAYMTVRLLVFTSWVYKLESIFFPTDCKKMPSQIFKSETPSG